MFRKKNSLLRFCSIITILFFFCVIDSGAQVRKTPTVIDKSKVTDIKQAEVIPAKTDVTKATTVTIPEPTITTHPTGANVTVGNNATFTVAATGAGISYQWQVSTNGTSWADVKNASPYSGATTTTLTVKSEGALHNYKYRCTVKNTGGSVTSNAGTLTVVSASAGGVLEKAQAAQVQNKAPEITAQPANASITANANATFTIGSTSNSTPTFQWQSSKDGKTWANVANAAPHSGAATNKLTITKATVSLNNYQYRCEVKNPNGTVTSNAATLTVKAALPVITAHPVDVSTDKATATFTVTATGDPAPVYQWWVSRDSGQSWMPAYTMTAVDPSFSGNNTNKLTVSGGTYGITPANNFKFKCMVTNSGGLVYSNAATLKIAPPTITQQPQSVTVSSGASTSFSVTATGATSYRWENASPGKTDWSDAKSATWYSGYQTNKLTVKTQYKDADGYTNSIKSGLKFRCIVGNDATWGTSNEATLTIGSSSATQPKTGTTKTNFGLTVSGGTVTWKSNFTELPIGSKITTIKNVSGSPIAIQESNGKNLVRLNNNANTGDTFKGRDAWSLTLYCVSGAPMYDASNPNQTKTGPAIEVSWTME